MNPHEHIGAALDFLALAEDSPVAQQAILLRSELLWCAAAHAVKAAAKRRGWDNETHDGLFRIVRRLSRNPGNNHLPRWFQWASSLHRNMYEGYMDDRGISIGRRQVMQLVHRLAGPVG